MRSDQPCVHEFGLIGIALPELEEKLERVMAYLKTIRILALANCRAVLW